MPSSLAKSDAAQTLNASALTQLRSDIIACRLMPNERLRVEALRERYGMGTSPIREALMRLEAEGLVELEQNKGFKVSEVSRENLLDLMRTRIEIETSRCAGRWRRAASNGRPDLLSAFTGCRGRPSRSGNPDDQRAWSKEHADFHAALVSACGSRPAVDLLALFEQAERYVALSIISNGPLRDDVTEHKQLMRAALTATSTRRSSSIARISTEPWARSRRARRQQARSRAAERKEKKDASNERAGQTGCSAPCRKRLGDFVARLFAAAGVPAMRPRHGRSRARRCRFGGSSSHGVMLVDLYIERIRKARSPATKAHRHIRSPGRGRARRRNALGQLTGLQAMDMAIGKAKEFATGIVAVRHGFHFGTAGTYAQQAAAADCIGIAMCNTRPLMPAPGGAERVVGNNPIAVALPTDGEIPLCSTWRPAKRPWAKSAWPRKPKNRSRRPGR